RGGRRGTTDGGRERNATWGVGSGRCSAVSSTPRVRDARCARVGLELVPQIIAGAERPAAQRGPNPSGPRRASLRPRRRLCVSARTPAGRGAGTRDQSAGVLWRSVRTARTGRDGVVPRDPGRLVGLVGDGLRGTGPSAVVHSLGARARRYVDRLAAPGA